MISQTAARSYVCMDYFACVIFHLGISLKNCKHVPHPSSRPKIENDLSLF